MTHYLHFYELTKAPFSPSADSEFLYWSPARQVLRQTLERAIAERRGLMILTGADGIGKTTLLHAVLERTTLQPLKVIFAPLDAPSPLRLLKTVGEELAQDVTREDAAVTPHEQLGLETYSTGDEGTTLFRYLSSLLMDEYQRGVNVVLVIDDAHTYPAKSLLWLCHLANLRVAGKSLVQIILVGRPALDETVNSLWLWRMRRQLAVRACVTPLTARESQAYLHRRLTAAAYGATPVLWPEGIALLAKHGQGVPRLLNMLGHDVLSAGFAAEQRPIATEVVCSVLPNAAQPSLRSAVFSRVVPLMKKVAGLVVVIGGMTTLSLSGASYLRSRPPPILVSTVTMKPDEVNAFATAPTRKETTPEAGKLQEGILWEAAPPAPPLLQETFVPQGLTPGVATPPTQSGATRSSPVVSSEPQPTPVASVSPTPSTTAKTDLGKRDADKQSPQPPPEKSVPAKQLIVPPARPLARTPKAVLPQTRSSAATTPTRQRKSHTSAKEEKVKKVAKPHVERAKVPLPPQQRTAVKRPSPPRTNLSHQRAVVSPPAKKSARRGNNDRLFDE